MTMDETKALLAEAGASGDPTRVAAAALRKMAKGWQQESRVNAAVNQAKAALSLAESRWADKFSALAASASAEERNGVEAETRIKAEIAEAEARLRLVGTEPCGEGPCCGCPGQERVRGRDQRAACCRHDCRQVVPHRTSWRVLTEGRYARSVPGATSRSRR
ncbi:MAG: hypothetical protein ACRELW_16185, partial [Candidatus Rokuibacteriota bacterium]